MERKGRQSEESRTAHGPQRKNKKRRLAVDSQHSLLPKEGTSLQQVRTGQEKHAQLQVLVFTTSCSLAGRKGRAANRPLLRTEND